MNDWWKLLGAAALAFVFGLVLDQIRQGGRRRRLRRDMRELLELLVLVEDRSSAAMPLNRELLGVMRRYFEPPAAPATRWVTWPLVVIWYLGSVLLLSLIFGAHPRDWVLTLWGLGTGVLGAITVVPAGEWLRHRLWPEPP